MKLTNREVRRRYSALQALSNRILPSRESELRVATLIRSYFAEPFQTSEDLNQKIILKDFPAPEDSETIPPGILEARTKAVNELMDLEVDVKDVPDHLLIKETDLPKAIKGKDENQKGVADIMASLGTIYKPFKERAENGDVDEEPEEEEKK